MNPIDGDKKVDDAVELPATAVENMDPAPKLLAGMRRASGAVAASVGGTLIAVALSIALKGDAVRPEVQTDKVVDVAPDAADETPVIVEGEPSPVLEDVLTAEDVEMLADVAPLSPEEAHMLGGALVLAGGEAGDAPGFFERGIFKVDWENFDRWELLQAFTTASIPEWISALTGGLGLEVMVFAWAVFLVVRRKSVPWHWKAIALPPVGLEWALRKITGKAEWYGEPEEKEKLLIPTLADILNESTLEMASLSDGNQRKLKMTYAGAEKFLGYAPNVSKVEALALLKNLIQWRFHDLSVSDRIDAAQIVRSEMQTRQGEIDTINGSTSRGPNDTDRRNKLVAANMAAQTRFTAIGSDLNGHLGSSASLFSALAADPMRFKTIARNAYKNEAALGAALEIVEPVMRERGFTPDMIEAGRTGAREIMALIRSPRSAKSLQREREIVTSALSAGAERYTAAVAMALEAAPDPADLEATAAYRNAGSFADAYRILQGRRDQLQGQMGWLDRDRQQFDEKYPLGSGARKAALTALALAVSGALSGGVYQACKTGWIGGDEAAKNAEVNEVESRREAPAQRTIDRENQNEADKMRDEIDEIGRQIRNK